METELTGRLTGRKERLWMEFLQRLELGTQEQTERTVLLWEGETLIATGSRQGNILKCLAVDPVRQGEGLMATVVSALRADAFAAGHSHLFLYTKPRNKWLLQSLFFYPVAQTEQVLLMENRKNGLADFLSALPPAPEGKPVGAAVMNCDPFTRGHRYLIEQGARECGHFFVFVLSEDQSNFPAADRLELVRRGTAGLSNVTVLPTGPYLLSAATFPTYFLKNREAATQVRCELDIQIFARHFAPRLGITRRYVGTEPLSPMTAQYNEVLKAQLPAMGIQVVEIPRLQEGGAPVSASRVRALLAEGKRDALTALLPDTTLEYLLKTDRIEK